MPFLTSAPNSPGSIVLPSNPYLDPIDGRAHIILAHPSEVNGLILTRGENAYVRKDSGYLKGEERTIAGALRMTGSPNRKLEAECNFIVDLTMATHFRRLLEFQQSMNPVTLIDNWTTGRFKTCLCELSIGDDKWETVQPGGMFLLQFMVFEV